MRTTLSVVLVGLGALVCACSNDDGNAQVTGASTSPPTTSTTPTTPTMSTPPASGGAAPAMARAGSGSAGTSVTTTPGSAGMGAMAGAAGASGSPPMAATTPAAGAPAAGSGGMAAPNTMTNLPVVPVEKPTWKACGNYECATLKAPIDYANPSAGMLDIALKRSVARGGQRIGSLFINPGGPGGSGVEFVSDFVEGPGKALSQMFDIVGFDPRGVGESTPLDCHSKLVQLIAVDPSPSNDMQWSAIDDISKQFADECGMKYMSLLPHLGTWDVARDLDRMREAVGDDKINYLGFSYGTEIGSYYAELFPDRIRVMVLDGALDNTLSAMDLALAQADGFELALKQYFDWCKGGATRCSWAGTQAPDAAFDAMMKSVETKPLKADRPVGPGEFSLGVIFPLYGGEQGWQLLSLALQSAASGDGSVLLDMVDSYLEKKDDGTYSNIQEMNNAVNCLDRPTPDFAGVKAEADHFAMEAPRFGLPSLTSQLVCSHWPVQGPPVVVPKGHGAPPIVVVGTTHDPATPYAWAGALAKQLESGVLLTNEGEGHTAYGRGSTCIDKAVETYLETEKPPAEGTTCDGATNVSMMMLRLPRMR